MKPLCPATNLTTQQQSELTVPQPGTDLARLAQRRRPALRRCLLLFAGHQARLNYPGDLPRVPPIAVTRTWTPADRGGGRYPPRIPAPTENSPMVPASEESEEVTEVSVSEASEEVGTAAETPVTDWSYLDLMTTNGFPLVDDFYYDFMALVDGAPGLTVDAAAEEGGGGFEASTVLWNFHDS
ncbi:uncharacterized protein A4U43_C08F26650 [Asparagus officinalis]|nr:uncharacterized protein A4U43_C08F26650 [Asparagus officinalis]